jgi:hypothetical protein
LPNGAFQASPPPSAKTRVGGGIYSIGANLLAVRFQVPENPARLSFAWSVAALWTGLLTSDFSLEYVASYSALHFRFSTSSRRYGVGQGSLLFWTWLLSIFTSIAIFQIKRMN